MDFIQIKKDVLVRRLTINDYQDVVELSKGVYDGYDHVPRSFKNWINDSNHHVYGIEKNGRLVGLTCRTIIDSGKTLLPEGERIMSEYRNIGLNSLLNQGTSILTGEYVKNTLRKRWTTTQVYDIRVLEHFKMPSLLETFGTMNIESIEYINLHQNNYRLFQLNYREFYELLKGRDFDYVITSFKVFENSLDNMDILENGKFTQNTHQFWRTKDGFSLNCIRLLTKGDAYFVTVYSNDYIDFKNQLGFHFRKFINGTSDVMCIHGNYFMMKEYCKHHNLQFKITYLYEQTNLQNKL